MPVTTPTDPAVTAARITALTAGQTVTGAFARTVAEHGGKVALRWRVGPEWATATWADWARDSARLATGLSGLGVGAGSRVLLLLRNTPEFHLLDMAVLLCGGTPISVYASSSPEQLAYLAGHSGAVVAVAEDAEMLGRFQAVVADLPALTHLVLVHGVAGEGVHSYADLLDHEEADLHRAAEATRPSDVATVIYTSGTTGQPKGVVLDHANVMWTAQSYVELVGDRFEGLRCVSYLPMAHIAERMSSHYLGIVRGLEVTTCPDPSKLAEYLRETRPQTMFGVPRVWEKLYAGVRAALSADPEREAQFAGAVAAGEQLDAARLAGELTPDQQAMADALDEKAFRPVRQLLGLDELLFAVTGAAPIPVGVLRWFRAIGVPMSEIFGMSESTGPVAWDPFAVRLNTVGRAIPGLELKLLDDGELCYRGGNVFRGYLDDPERTAEALDDEGFVHSGDIAVVDEDGYVSIVDRKKELIITAGGKNISPANLESALKAFPLIGQAAVIGDNRPFVSALLVLDPDVAPAWARSHGVAATDLATLAKDPTVLAEVDANVTAAMAVFNQAERVKRWTLLPAEWLPDSEELTPTMKLKRRGVNAKYASEIEALYG